MTFRGAFFLSKMEGQKCPFSFRNKNEKKRLLLSLFAEHEKNHHQFINVKKCEFESISSLPFS
jgi:hypothetical protein